MIIVARPRRRHAGGGTRRQGAAARGHEARRAHAGQRRQCCCAGRRRHARSMRRSTTSSNSGRKEASAEPPPASSAAAIDPSAFSALEKSFGAATLVEILQSYIVTAEALCRALGEASADENWDGSNAAGAGHRRQRRRPGPDRDDAGGTRLRPGRARRRVARTNCATPRSHRVGARARAAFADQSLSGPCGLKSSHAFQFPVRSAYWYKCRTKSLRALICPRLCPRRAARSCARRMAAARRVADSTRRGACFASGDVLVAHAAFVAGRLKTQPAARAVRRAGAVRLRAARPALRAERAGTGALSRPRHPAHAGRVRARAARSGSAPAGRTRAAAPRKRAPRCAACRRRWARRAGAGRRSFSMPSAGSDEKLSPIAGLEAWRGLPQWEDDAAPDKPGSRPSTPSEARARLQQLVGLAGEPRPEQAAYTDAATYAFGPRERAGAPRIALVEAGTGTGKTLGYLAPASAVGGEERPGPLDLHLHPQSAAPDRAGDRPSLSRSRRARRKGGGAQGPGELSLPAEFRGSGEAHRAGAGTARAWRWA